MKCEDSTTGVSANRRRPLFCDMKTTTQTHHHQDKTASRGFGLHWAFPAKPVFAVV